MVKQCRGPTSNFCGSVRETRTEYSGSITSRPAKASVPLPSVPTPPPMTGRIKCISGDSGEFSEVIHFTNRGQTATLCRRQIIERRPYMGSVMWGSAGYGWCERCAEKLFGGDE